MEMELQEDDAEVVLQRQVSSATIKEKLVAVKL